MGVTGLWGLLEPAGKPTRIQSLRGKVLAVDVSIWLHQSVKGFRDRDGNPIRNSHLLGVFHRVCKLLSNGIKPVFVFDGGVPVLKKQTMSNRRKRKIEAQDKSHASRKKLIQNLLRQQLQRQYLTDLPPAAEIDAEVERIMKAAEEKTGEITDPVESKKSKPSTTPKKKAASSADDGFEDDFGKFREMLTENFNNFSIFLSELDALSESGSESGEEDHKPIAPVRGYDENFDAIISPTFDELPLEVQHDMLYEMQESRKNNSWGKMDQMPKGLQNFSSFQMERLRKRRTLQKKIQSVQQEMGQRHIHLTNFDDLASFSYDDIPTGPQTQQVIVSKTKETGMIYVKSTGPTDEKPTSSKKELEPVELNDAVENWSSSEDEVITEEQELQRAIQLSLQSGEDDKKEVEEVTRKSNPEPSLNVIQQLRETEEEQLQRALQLSLKEQQDKEENEAVLAAAIFAKSLANAARNEVISLDSEEHSVETPEKPSDIQPIVDKLGDVAAPNKTINKAELTLRESEGDIVIPPKKIQDKSENPEDVMEVSISSPSECDFEEVPIPTPAVATDVEKLEEKPVLTIVFNRDEKLKEEDDIFADIFEVKEEEPETSNEAVKELKEVAIVEDMESDSDFENVQMPEEKLEDEEAEVLEEKKIERTLGTDPAKSMRMVTAQYMQAQEKLVREKEELKTAAGFQERVATSITDQMYTEAQELLALFGVPYIVSPMEAESQCAFLDIACLTEGTITDDSDVWLFGAQRVYKNFFSQGDRPLCLYQYADIVQQLNLDREKLILIAMLTGSDYTDGVEGVGPVRALEILSEFPSKSLCALDSLVAFREWWERARDNKKLDAENKIRSKFRNLKLRPGFPNKTVWDAYMNPTLDESLEQFRWGTPDLEALRGYTKNRFGWNQQKADAALLPLIKSLSCQSEDVAGRQLTIDSFFRVVESEKKLDDTGGKRKMKSKRLQQAMKKLKERVPSSAEIKLSSDSDSDTEPISAPSLTLPNVIPEESEEKELDDLLVKMGVKKIRGAPSSSGSRRGGSPKKNFVRSLSSSIASVSSCGVVVPPEPVVNSPIKTPTKKPDVIPQKAREEFQRRLNKKKAIELLKAKKK